MGENASKIGKELENFADLLVSHFGWEILVRNQEITCTKSSHKKKTHGIDLLCKFYNPYLDGKQAVVIECKNWQMCNINNKAIEGWITELINSIDCAQTADELKGLDYSGVISNTTGLLLINASEGWNEAAFYSYLKTISIPNRRIPINIYIAANDKTEMWMSLLQKIEKDYTKDFSFIYPSINGNDMKKIKTFTLDAMFSKYVFAESTYEKTEEKDGMPYSVPCKQSIMFFMDDICIDNFKYAWSMFKHFQFQAKDKYTFVFYPRSKNDIELINSTFISSLKAIEHPISQDEVNKINIEFIENKNLNTVYSGGLL